MGANWWTPFLAVGDSYAVYGVACLNWSHLVVGLRTAGLSLQHAAAVTNIPSIVVLIAARHV